MLKIDIAAGALKQMRRLPAKHSRQIKGKIDALANDSEPPDSSQLKGKAAAWRRADSGEYRIIYRVEDDVLKVAAIGNRNDDKVYRDFERKA